MIETKNFNPTVDRKLLCTCGHEKCDKRSVSQEVLDRVQLLRDEVKRPLTITSGGRCKHHPSEASRTIPADHQKQQAVDIKVDNGIERGEIVAAAIMLEFNAIGVANSFVHLGIRKELPVGVVIMWTY